jgi:hypothetical protein
MAAVEVVSRLWRFMIAAFLPRRSRAAKSLRDKQFRVSSFALQRQELIQRGDAEARRKAKSGVSFPVSSF